MIGRSGDYSGRNKDHPLTLCFYMRLLNQLSCLSAGYWTMSHSVNQAGFAQHGRSGRDGSVPTAAALPHAPHDGRGGWRGVAEAPACDVLDVVGELTEPELALCRKDKGKATELKGRGNACFSRREFEQALGFYSQILEKLYHPNHIIIAHKLIKVVSIDLSLGDGASAAAALEKDRVLQ
ncbi:hypothetical protein ABZP36_012375 [Zizania latifolia]